MTMLYTSYDNSLCNNNLLENIFCVCVSTNPEDEGEGPPPFGGNLTIKERNLKVLEVTLGEERKPLLLSCRSLFPLQHT